jgi:hypothetical protein
MNKDMINTRNTREWVKCNDDSKSHLYRDKFVAEHGGEFVKNGTSWEWKFIHNDVNEDLKPLYEFKDTDGVTYLVDNLMKFCRQHDLNKSAIYKVMNGERSHHKGFVCKKVYQQ